MDGWKMGDTGKRRRGGQRREGSPFRVTDHADAWMDDV